MADNAFDWSPGGCCCGPKPGWFDIFAFSPSGGVPAFEFQRLPSIFPVGKTPPYNSKNTIAWSIPTAAADGTLVGHDGITRDGEFVWSIDYMLPVGGNQIFQRLSGYNPVTKTQAFTIRTNTNSLPHVNVYVGADKCAANIAAAGGGSSALCEVSKSGVIDSWAGTNLGSAKILASGQFLTIFEHLYRPAYLDWPKWIGGKSRSFGGGLIAPIGGYRYEELWLCEAGKAVPPADYPQMNNRQPLSVLNPSGTTTQVLGFDQLGTDWVAAVDMQDGASRKFAVFKNNVKVAERPLPFVDTPGSRFPYTSPELQPHVCFPHETLGGGFVAVPEWKWVVGASGEYISKTSSLAVYRNGAEVWRTIDFNHAFPMQVLGSTDRWIYFKSGQGAGETTFISAMTKGKFSQPGGDTGQTQYWLAKHDGSEIMPMGQLSDTKFQIAGASSGARYIPFDTVLRNSALIENSIPATYQEMYDNRAG